MSPGDTYIYGAGCGTERVAKETEADKEEKALGESTGKCWQEPTDVEHSKY